MLYQKTSGFIDIVIEPQFKEFTFGSQLCSVRSTDLSTLMSMKNSVRGEIDFNQYDPMYPFTGFGYLDDLARDLRTRSLLQLVDHAESNFTRSPTAFTYLGFEEDDEFGFEVDAWKGDIYPNEVHDFQYRVDASFEYFRVWPLFHVPAGLREELEPGL